MEDEEKEIVPPPIARGTLVVIDHSSECECAVCGERDCPYGEPLHYHHDGCPACDS